MRFLNLTSVGMFWNEGGEYVFYAESLDPGNDRRPTLSSHDDRRECAERVSFRTGLRERPAQPDLATGRRLTPRFRAI